MLHSMRLWCAARVFHVVNYLNAGVLPKREGSHSTSSAGYGTYTCKDGVNLYILILGAGVVRNAGKVPGIDIAEDPFYDGMGLCGMDTPAGDILEGKLAEFFGTHTGAEAEEILLEAGVPCSRIYTFAAIAMPTLTTKRVKRLPRGKTPTMTKRCAV